MMIFVILISILAFFFDCNKAWLVNGDYTDLYRFYYDIGIFRKHGWNTPDQYFKTAYSTMPITKAYIYLISLLRIDGFLPAITCFIVYGLMAKLINEVGKKNNIRIVTICFAFLYFVALNNYKVSITNIRLPIAFALFMILIYNDLVKNKHKFLCYVGYFSLVLIHNSMIIWLAIYFLAKLANRFTLLYLCLFTLASNVLLQITSIILKNFPSSNFINNILYKIDFYTSQQMLESTRGEWQVWLIASLRFIVFAYMLFYIWQRNNHIIRNSNYNKLFIFSVILCTFGIGSIWNFHLFNRISNFSVYLMPLWILVIFNFSNNINIIKIKYFRFNSDHTLLLVLIWINIIVHMFLYFYFYHYNVLCF